MFTKAFLGIFVLLAGYGLFNQVQLGSKSTQYTYEKLKSTAKREEAIKTAVIRYIVDTNTTPTIQTLIDNGYISSTVDDNGFGGKFILNIDRAKGTISLSTTFTKDEQTNIYSNLYTRTLQGTISGKTITTKHLIPTHLSSNTDLQDSFRTFIGNTSPDPTKYSYWIDTSGNSALKKFYQNSSWKVFNVNLSIDKAVSSSDTVTGVSRLNDEGASAGDIKYVYNTATNTIDEYVYYNDIWALKGGANGDITVTDIEGHIYKPVVVGNQTWLDRNMRTKYYLDDSLIIHPYDYNLSNSFSYSETQKDSNIESDESDSINDTDGYLYQRMSAIQSNTTEYIRGICPYGYHVPSRSDFNTLFHYLDPTYEINATWGNHGTTVGKEVRIGGSSGLNLTTGGYRAWNSLDFKSKEWYGYYRTSTLNYAYRLHFSANSIKISTMTDRMAMSVRCMKDQRNLLDVNDIFGDGSIIGTWQLNGNGDELGGNYTGTSEHGRYDNAYFDNGLYVDGEKHYVPTTFNPHTDANFGDNHSFALSAWIYINSDEDDGDYYQYIIKTPSSTSDCSFDIAYNNSNDKLGINLGGKWIYGASVLEKERWINIVCMYDGTDVSIYLDGVLDSSTAYTGNGLYPDYTFNISTPYNNQYHLMGKIDQVRLFNRILTPFEIQTLFSEKKTK